jgi:hypothetical protein
MGRRFAVMGTLVVALLGAPRPSSAGLLEIIWEMSGPQMIGLSYACMYGVTSRSLEQCRIGQLITKDWLVGRGKGPYLVLGGGIFGSTSKDSSTQSYDWGEVWMVALEPGVAVRSYETSTVQIHHAAGISYALLFGDDFRRFDKFAFTVTPIDVAYKRVAVGVKLRMYPNGFTDDEFKAFLPRVSGNRPFETTIGFTFSLIVGPH